MATAFSGHCYLVNLSGDRVEGVWRRGCGGGALIFPRSSLHTWTVTRNVRQPTGEHALTAAWCWPDAVHAGPVLA